MVLLISFGMTTLPRSSILRTIPVAFIYKISLFSNSRVILLFAKQGGLYRKLDFLIIRDIKAKITRLKTGFGVARTALHHRWLTLCVVLCVVFILLACTLTDKIRMLIFKLIRVDCLTQKAEKLIISLFNAVYAKLEKHLNTTAN